MVGERSRRGAAIRAIGGLVLAVAGAVGFTSSAWAGATFYVNDGTDGTCSTVADTANPSGNFLSGQKSANCNVSSVNDINENLSLGSNGGGSMVLNGNGLFLNNKMQINGTMSLNNHKLIDLAAGTADTDGVNVAQLRGVLAGLGGGAGIDGNGNVIAPNYTIGGTTYNNVGDALKNLDDRVTANTDAINSANSKIDDVDQRVTNVENNNNPYVNVNSSNSPSTANGQSTVSIGGGAQANGNNSTALGENAIANGSNSVALGNGSVADEADTVSVGSSSQQRRITNVAAGQNPTDAVNKSQLDGLRNDMNAAIGTVARAAYSGVAAATALTMIPDVDPGKTLAIGIGTANFKGYQAGALGASARVTPNLKLKVGAGMSAAGTTVGGGASYQW